MAPENVRVDLPNGDTLTLDLHYSGVEDGLHVWIAPTPDGIYQDLLTGRLNVSIGRLPARTSVRLMPRSDWRRNKKGTP